MNTLLLLSSRVAPFVAASILCAALVSAPARASVVANSTSFNGSFDAVVTQTGTAEVTGDGTSFDSPVGLVSEHFVYDATNYPVNNVVSFAGYSLFSTLDGTSTLYANVVGTVNILTYK